ncbi:MAG: NUDIX hydrolase [Anaerolineaceae bacterium]
MKFEWLSQKNQYVGHAFQVEKVEIRLPDGNSRFFDLVTHSGAVTIVPVDAEGGIWFVRQFRVGSNSELLELPAGTLDAGEDPLHCAKREIREEIGMAAGSMTKIGEMYLAPGYSTEYMHIYLATGLVHNPLTPDADEFLETEIIPIEKAFEMAARGEIKDSKSLAALLLAQPHLNGTNK